MSKITAEGENNLPGEAELAKIQRYIELTGVTFPVGTPHHRRAAV